MFALSRAIRPDDLPILAQIPGVACVARDEELRLFWCTPAFIRLSGRSETAEELKGTTLAEILPPVAAAERDDVHRWVIEHDQAQSQYAFNADTRVLCTVFPLDSEAFGHRGVLAVLKDAPIDARLGIDREIPVLSTPNLFELNSLSPRELEVLHSIAKGRSTQEIADGIVRAVKTVEHHINAIHGKLGTHSRAQLVRFASERGIQSFSEDEWASIVEGARRVRRGTPS